MKRRYMFVLVVVMALLAIRGTTVLAQPADSRPRRDPVVRVGVAWGAIIRDQGRVHNFVRSPTDEMPVITVLLGTEVRFAAGASGIWLGEPGGTLAAHLGVRASDDQGNEVLLGEDRVADTRVGPAFKQGKLEVPVSFDRPGEAQLTLRLTSVAEPAEGERVHDSDARQITVVVLDPSTLGSISGQVTADDTGDGLDGVVVMAANRDMRIHRTTQTDADGAYLLKGLPPGEYIVRVQAKGTAYVGEFYENAQSPDEAPPVMVNEGSETTGISLSLSRGAEIAGKIVDEVTGEPLAGIPIVVKHDRAGDARPVDGVPAAPARQPDLQGPPASQGPAGAGGPRPRPSAVTGEDGRYVVRGLPAGEYTVAAVGHRHGYAIEFWEEASRPEDATPIAVELGQVVPDVDFTLAEHVEGF